MQFATNWSFSNLAFPISVLLFFAVVQFNVQVSYWMNYGLLLAVRHKEANEGIYRLMEGPCSACCYFCFNYWGYIEEYFIHQMKLSQRDY